MSTTKGSGSLTKANTEDWHKLLSVTVKTYGSLVLGKPKTAWIKLKELH